MHLEPKISLPIEITSSLYLYLINTFTTITILNTNLLVLICVDYAIKWFERGFGGG